jgi:hypothetical protein
MGTGAAWTDACCSNDSTQAVTCVAGAECRPQPGRSRPLPRLLHLHTEPPQRTGAQACFGAQHGTATARLAPSKSRARLQLPHLASSRERAPSWVVGPRYPAIRAAGVRGLLLLLGLRRDECRRRLVWRPVVGGEPAPCGLDPGPARVCVAAGRRTCSQFGMQSWQPAQGCGRAQQVSSPERQLNPNTLRRAAHVACLLGARIEPRSRGTCGWAEAPGR